MAQSIMEQRWGQIRGVADEKSVNVCYPRKTVSLESATVSLGLGCY